ncbi:MAG TPA: PilN domain-containing protein [Candidatus Saccharimonadales bacterium]|nr:PilN domain-containing protein [Candidatus Saccharimonadales bacterium]
MINLLPAEEKRQLRAARTNTLLIRYNIALLCAGVFLSIALGVVYVYLGTAKANSEQIISDNKAKASGYAAVESEANIFRSNLAIAKQILENEVTYSKVILAIANLLPPGTTLDKLSLDSSTFGTPTTLSAQAKSYENALALKDAFQKSSLFSDVHFQSITSNVGTQSGAYPYTVNLDVTIKKDAAK